MWKACRMNCTTSTAPSAHVCTVQHALWSAKVSAKVKASTGTREIEATGLNCATLFLPWHVFQTVFLTKPQHRIYRMRCIQCIPRYFCTRPWLKQNAFGTHFATGKGDVCLRKLFQSLPFSSIFGTLLHDAGKCDTPPPVLYRFLYMGNFKFQAGCCARWSSWDTRYLRHFVKSGWPVKPVSPESRSQVEIDTLIPGFLQRAPRMTNQKPSCTEIQRSTKAIWNMDGTWMEHGWNIVALGCTWELSQLPEHFCDKSWSKENGAASSPSAALQFGLLRPGLPALLRMPEARKTEYFSLDRSTRCEARSMESSSKAPSV